MGRTATLSAVAVALVVASCAGPSGSPSIPPSTLPAGTVPTGSSPPTPTAAPTTTTVVGSAPTTITVTSTPTTTTTVGSTPTTPESSGPYRVTDPARLTPPDPLPGSGGAAGSGCAPGTEDLPDGVWYGYVTEIRPDSVVFDLACFFFGDVAWEKAAETGEEAPNDVWIVNENPRLRTLEVAGDAVVWSITADPTLGRQGVAFGDWPTSPNTYIPCPGEFCGVWLYVNGGRVTEIGEQYLP